MLKIPTQRQTLLTGWVALCCLIWPLFFNVADNISMIPLSLKSLFFLVSFFCFYYFSKLDILLLEIGWLLVCTTLLFEVFDEIFNQPLLWHDIAKPVVGSIGMLFIARGLYRTHQRSNKRNCQQNLEEVIAERTLELKRSNEDLQHFAYAVSHDLKEPLRMITSYLQLIERRYAPQLDKEGREFVSFAAEGGHRMQSMIKDLLDYSRVNSRNSEMISLDCEEIIKSTISNLRAAIEESNAQISSDNLPRLPADPTQLERLFQNLISNAIKYRSSSRTPKIHIAAVQENENWHFSIKDNGIGINPRFHDRIFGVFERLHNHDDYDGTGVGLAICKRIVERHRGKIWVDSVENKGSTFHFTLPVNP